MSDVILTGKNRGLAIGLEWRALHDYAPKRPVSAEVRGLASENEAERIIVHAVQSGSAIRASLGMYVRSDPDDKLPSEVHSLAAVLVHAFPNEENIVLAWRLESRSAVIVVQGGVPEVDELKDTPEAVILVKKAIEGGFGSSGHRLLTNDLQSFGDGDILSLDSLSPYFSKSTRVAVVPVKPSSIAAAVLLTTLVGAASIGVIQWKKHSKQEQIKKELAASDPVRPYQLALDASMKQMGFARKDLVANIKALGTYPAWQDGWLLNKIECVPGQCTSNWTRMGGTTLALVAARKGEQIQPESTDDRVSLTWTTTFNPAGLESQPNAIPGDIARQQNTDTFQKWRNAKLSVTEHADDYKVWPTPTAGDASRLPKEIALFSRGVEASVPLPFANEVINSAPAAIWWHSFSIVFAPGEKGRMFQLNLKGNTYVR